MFQYSLLLWWPEVTQLFCSPTCSQKLHTWLQLPYNFIVVVSHSCGVSGPKWQCHNDHTWQVCCSAGNQTWSLTLMRQMLYHWAIPGLSLHFFCKKSLGSIGFAVIQAHLGCSGLTSVSVLLCSGITPGCAEAGIKPGLAALEADTLSAVCFTGPFFIFFSWRGTPS